jgi:FkbM family methyltransferase
VQNLLANYQEQLVVISVSWQFQQEIKTQLVKLGIPLDKILLLPQDPLQYATFNSEHSWPLEDIKLNLQQLEKVYQLLFDSKSKNLYLTRLSLLAGAYNYKAYKAYIRNYADLVNDYNEGSDVDSAPIYDEDYFYFNNEIFELHDDEVFVNVGALVGNCAQNFIETCKQKNVRYKQIINFEPDPINFAFLEKNMQPFDGIENINAGLWNKKDTLRFSSPQDKSIGIPGLIDQNGEVEIDVYSLDELFPESGVTYIKMDVEGAELKALEGAAETIKNNKPKLAISLYHKRDDIWQIPLLLNNLVAEYKFFIRHYSTTFTETVLYALP